MELGVRETRNEHARDTDSAQSGLVEQVEQIFGDVKWCPGLLRLVMVRRTRKSNQGNRWNGGGQSQRNRMSKLGLVI